MRNSGCQNTQPVPEHFQASRKAHKAAKAHKGSGMRHGGGERRAGKKRHPQKTHSSSSETSAKALLFTPGTRAVTPMGGLGESFPQPPEALLPFPTLSKKNHYRAQYSPASTVSLIKTSKKERHYEKTKKTQRVDIRHPGCRRTPDGGTGLKHSDACRRAEHRQLPGGRHYRLMRHLTQCGPAATRRHTAQQAPWSWTWTAPYP